MNYRKNIKKYSVLLATLLLIMIAGCQNKQGYTVNGTIHGDVENAKVFLQKRDYISEPIVDSTVIKDGKFFLEGTVDFPGVYTIIIDRTPEGEKSNPQYKNVSNFYLENSNITLDGDINTLPGFYYNPVRKTVKATIKGSKAQALMEDYYVSVASLSKQLSELDKRYRDEYLTPYIKEGVENVELGISITNKENEINALLLDKKLEFIRSNSSSIVAFDFVSYFFTGMYVDFTVDEIDEMVSWLARDWEGTELFEQLEQKAKAAKRVALGEEFKDIELLTRNGELVKLSSLIKQGQYNMLEFWASWCGPCRGEIPHLKRVHEEYKDKGFNIISISVDSKDKDWHKAMEEEGMVWTQLRDPNGRNGDTKKVYNVSGVPTCIVLDKDNRIYKTNMRGAYLDAFLELEFN